MSMDVKVKTNSGKIWRTNGFFLSKLIFVCAVNCYNGLVVVAVDIVVNVAVIGKLNQT